MILSCWYSLKAGFAVASKESALEFEIRDIQLVLLLLALVSVFERTWMVWGVFVGAVVPQPGQHYDKVREAMGPHTFLPSRMLLAGGDRGIHAPCI